LQYSTKNPFFKKQDRSICYNLIAMRKLLFLLFTFFLLFSLLTYVNFVNAQSTDCSGDPKSWDLLKITSCLDELNKAKEQSEKATKPLEDQLAAIQNRVKFIENDLVVKEKSIRDGYKNLERQEKILAITVRDYYIKSYYNSPLLIFLTSNSASELTQMLGYQKATADRDKTIILNIAIMINGLEERKQKLEVEQREIVIVKEKLDKVVGEAKTYQANLSNQISKLSARQQEILSQRLAALNIPRSAGTSLRGCLDDRDVDPGFSPRIAFFTYGAPHRNGLNQYGAWGRAKDGQNEEQILSEYYPGKSLKKDYNQGVQISTTTGWSGTIEDYVKRIYEVPDSWTDNNLAVLKAQAVAARTYALNVTDNGSKQICTTESCQVFKPDPKGGNWEQAVNATAGWVLMDGDRPAFTQYASTHGGYIQNLGKFDGRNGNPANFSELNERAYDKESPWFYCDWGARASYNKTAWLKPTEVADIANAAKLAEITSQDSNITKHLLQLDKSNPDENWDEGRVKQELRSRNVNPLNSVSSVNVSADFSSGKTTTITINGDGDTMSFSGDFFKSYFNLRAPANIQIVGPLYNIEQR
jgi:SpoIID/LytB domain protein